MMHPSRPWILPGTRCGTFGSKQQPWRPVALLPPPIHPSNVPLNLAPPVNQPPPSTFVRIPAWLQQNRSPLSAAAQPHHPTHRGLD